MSCTDASEAETPKILAAASLLGRRVELLQYRDGRTVIFSDGAEQASYRPGSENIESCIRTYLAMLRSSAQVQES